MYILEIKFHPKDFMLAQDIIHQSNFIPKRFSKYLRGLAINNLANYI